MNFLIFLEKSFYWTGSWTRPFLSLLLGRCFLG